MNITHSLEVVSEVGEGKDGVNVNDDEQQNEGVDESADVGLDGFDHVLQGPESLSHVQQHQRIA